VFVKSLRNADETRSSTVAGTLRDVSLTQRVDYVRSFRKTHRNSSKNTANIMYKIHCLCRHWDETVI